MVTNDTQSYLLWPPVKKKHTHTQRRPVSGGIYSHARRAERGARPHTQRTGFGASGTIALWSIHNNLPGTLKCNTSAGAVGYAVIFLYL